MTHTVHSVPASVWRNPIHFTAFGFGSGALPWMPGTWGTLVGALFYLGWQNMDLVWYLLMLVLTFFFGVWLCGKTEREVGVPDHSGIVWDEMVGLWVTMTYAPYGLFWLLLGVILFRLFDIWKPGPIRWLQTHCKGGWGVMLDDVGAGVAAFIVLQAIAWTVYSYN